MVYAKIIYQNEEKTFAIGNRQIISILMDSPFYFNFSIKERKEMLERVKNILK